MCIPLSLTTVYRNTLEFLRVTTSFRPEFRVVNPNASAWNLRLQKNLAQPPVALRQIARALVPPWLRSRVKRSLLDSNLVVRPRPPMDPRVRKRLQKELEPQVEQLGKLLGRDLSPWCVEASGNTGGSDEHP
jgi:hypothetical protein